MFLNSFPLEGKEQNPNILFPPNQKVNWRAINNVNVSHIVENVDLLALESFIPNLIGSKISREEFQKIDKANILKVLQLYQLSLEYFSYTHNYLSDLNEKINQENDNVKKEV